MSVSRMPYAPSGSNRNEDREIDYYYTVLNSGWFRHFDKTSIVFKIIIFGLSSLYYKS
jgi:hypothetical protein